MTPPLTSRRALGEALHGAVQRGEIHALYQPQIDLLTGEIVGAEALSRWTNQEWGPVPPANFIPLAEDSGVIHEIGRFMLDEGFRCAADWSRRGIPISISVNVSPAQLRDDDLGDYIAQNIDRRSVAPQMLTIEITESLPIDDVPGAVARLERIREMGVGVSIDDFGSGFSSLDLIEALPATEVKFDLSLLHDDRATASDLMKQIVAAVKPRGISIVAEGIETVAQLYRARDLGCDRAQGYLTGRPMTCRDLELVLLAA